MFRYSGIMKHEPIEYLGPKVKAILMYIVNIRWPNMLPFMLVLFMVVAVSK